MYPKVFSNILKLPKKVSSKFLLFNNAQFIVIKGFEDLSDKV